MTDSDTQSEYLVTDDEYRENGIAMDVDTDADMGMDMDMDMDTAMGTENGMSEYVGTENGMSEYMGTENGMPEYMGTENGVPGDDEGIILVWVPKCPRRLWVVFLRGLATIAAVAALSGLAADAGLNGWYADANKAPWTPPGVVFGVAWAVLYANLVLMYVMLRRVSPNRANGANGVGMLNSHSTGYARHVHAKDIWYLHVFLNLAWCPLFFWWAQVWLGLLDIVALWVVVAYSAWLNRTLHRTTLVWMHVVYLAWISYATTLNAYIAFA